MPKLIAKAALAGQAPLALGGVTLSETLLDSITSIAPLQGQDKALAKALKALGLTFPTPNSFAQKASARIVWTGRGQAFLINAAPEGQTAFAALTACAALTDQTDGWACLSLAGAPAEAALMRLVPLDLRGTAFPKGSAARAPLNHMQSILLRTGPHSFDLMVFRSMARSAWHEVETAMKSLAARQNVPV